MDEIIHTVSEVLRDELASKTFDLTPDERAAIIVALRMLSKDFEAMCGNKNYTPGMKKHAAFFVEQARSVIEKIGLPGV